MENAIPKRRESPLYSDAVYGMRNMKIMIDAISLRPGLPKRLAKKSGIVAESRCCVMMRVRRPSIDHASSEPMRALPMPAHVADMPYLQPNCPAYPTNTTAEKYDVPNANAVSHAPTALPPRTNPFTSVALRRQASPMATSTAK